MAKSEPSKSTRKSSSSSTGPQPPWLEFLLDFWLRFERFAWDVGGVLLLAVSLMTLLALVFPELTRGALLIWWSEVLRHWLGWGSFMMVVATAVLGFSMLGRRASRKLSIRWSRVFALEGAAFAGLILLTLFGGNSLERAESGLDGGVIGWGLTELTGLLLSPFWLILVASVIFFGGTIYGFGIGEWLAAGAQKLIEWASNSQSQNLGKDSGISVAPVEGVESSLSPDKSKKKKRTRLPPQFRKQFRLPAKEERPASAPPRDDRLPPLKLLVGGRTARPDERNINLTAGLIEKTLDEFGIPAKVIGFQVGPTVTQFAVKPGYIEKNGPEGESKQQKVRVSQISALSRDLALALSAERLRVQAPVPGRPYIGIEVPNIRSALVRLRPVLETEAFHRIDSPLAIALGRDVSGQPVVADLAAMPHLLIAGTTGSGKSVCIAALTTCLVMNNTPEDLRLVMIDPKMVELVRFNGLAHIYGKVETDLERILGVLRWVTVEMDQRYKLLEETRSRNIDTYNRKMRRRKGGQPLPRLVVMIDELADLMMSAPDQTEHSLVRLAQMARATGIHLVMATQRPSTDVVTGLIKANFPARMSFAVASSVDSRVILDLAGAETLLGNGDMLFLPPESAHPIRAQGVIITDQEIEKVITYWQENYQVEDEQKPPWEEMLEREADLAERDELIEEAIELVQETQRASTSMIQRQLRVGYPRAARIMDELEELGIVGPAVSGGRDRDVLIDPEEE
ncbi:MAG: DNA translocase FtsK [Anaerolineales bacterium]|jgi:S-DNA-T family DNA segregation ATPase FtsK/SpoIIIE